MSAVQGQMPFPTARLCGAAEIRADTAPSHAARPAWLARTNEKRLRYYGIGWRDAARRRIAACVRAAHQIRARRYGSG
jgi:hypothetical protein